MEIRKDWLALVEEDVVAPERPIVDPHHHFFLGSPRFPDYLLPDLWSDTGAGHRVEQTVFVQCGVHYREGGPPAEAPLGETEWVAGLAAESERGAPGSSQVAAIVGHADLTLGAEVRGVLEQHLELSDLFRGIRHMAYWDAWPDLNRAVGATDARMYADATFREGFAQLQPLGLTFDAYHYHTQTPYLTELARSFPETTIVLDHIGTPLGVGPYAGRRDEIFEDWKRDLAEVASCSNVLVKLGGMSMPLNGFGWEERARPLTSDEMVEAQGRYYRHAIEVFGPERCMFESNFPVDKISISYRVLWNAFKKLVADFSDAEQDAMLGGNAARVYRIDPAAKN